jgi:hypothetical protein
MQDSRRGLRNFRRSGGTIHLVYYGMMFGVQSVGLGSKALLRNVDKWDAGFHLHTYPTLLDHWVWASGRLGLEITCSSLVPGYNAGAPRATPDLADLDAIGEEDP